MEEEKGEEMGDEGINGFGENTYWNRPIEGKGRRLRTKYPNMPNIKAQTSKRSGTTTGTRKTSSPPRSTSPTLSQLLSRADMGIGIYPRPIEHPGRRKEQPGQPPPALDPEEEMDSKDEKAIVKLMKSTLPQFSNEADWEMAIFELSLVLDRVWPHKDNLNIMEYMTNPSYHSQTRMKLRADSLIYFALTLAAKKDSYAKMQIMAASHKDAVPCVLKNEGKKLYQMFQGMFTMTNLHQASLPSVRADFYAIAQKDNETILQYTSRVDITVATLAKLGEKISTGAWIYALGNGLAEEYKDCKHGILYNKPGFDTVMSVKTKLLSEEAVLTSKNKKASAEHSKAVKEKEDEIALLAFKAKEIKEANATNANDKSDTETKDKALLLAKGKGAKGKGKKGKPNGRSQWYPQDWQQWTTHTDDQTNYWAQPHGKGKGRGKGTKGTGFDAKKLWCDIHQQYGHSTDWCYQNPNRTNEAPPPSSDLWCETCNRQGHTANNCFATSIKISPKGKGKKGNPGDRNWKSQNFPAAYNSDQATPALHDESSSNKQIWWQDHELGSVLIDDKQNATHKQHNDTNQYEDEQAINDIDIKQMHERFPDESDEEVSAYIDLIILAIVNNAQRQEAYVKNPSVESLQEIRKHSTYITAAEGCTNVHVQRIIRNFKSLVKYADNFDPNNTHLIKHDENVDNKRTAEIETNEIDITRDKLQHNSTAEIELNELNNEMHDEIARQHRAEIETNETLEINSNTTA